MSVLRVECDPALPPWLHGEVESRLVFVDEDIAAARVVAAGGAIDLSLRSAAEGAREAIVVERVRRVVASMVKAVEPGSRVVEEQRTLDPACCFDADEALLRSRELHQESHGLAVIGPRLGSAIERLDARFAALALELGAGQYQFPALIEPALLERLNAFRYFPHTLGFASHLRRDLDSLERFSQSAHAGSEGLEAPPEVFASPRALLTPAVCYHLYGYLANQTIDDGRLVATTRGKCFRHESANMNTLARLWDFTVREIVFVGTPEFVLENRTRVQSLAREVFAALRLDYCVQSAHDHFFGTEFPRQSMLQNAFELKLEVRATLPHRQATLAVASYNYHQDFFGRRMNIKLPDGSIAHTACVGFGLERLAYALVSQLGLDGLRPALDAACPG